jgi:hypothetical protein
MNGSPADAGGRRAVHAVLWVLLGIFAVAFSACGSVERLGETAYVKETKEPIRAVYGVLELDDAMVYAEVGTRYAYLTLMQPYDDLARVEAFTFQVRVADVTRPFLKPLQVGERPVGISSAGMVVTEVRLDLEDPTVPLPTAIVVTRAGRNGLKTGEMLRNR